MSNIAGAVTQYVESLREFCRSYIRLDDLLSEAEDGVIVPENVLDICIEEAVSAEMRLKQFRKAAGYVGGYDINETIQFRGVRLEHGRLLGCGDPKVSFDQARDWLKDWKSMKKAEADVTFYEVGTYLLLLEQGRG